MTTAAHGADSSRPRGSRRPTLRITTIAWKLFSVRDRETTAYLKEQLALRMAQIAAYSDGGGSNGAAESGKFRPNVRQAQRPTPAVPALPSAEPSAGAPGAASTPPGTPSTGVPTQDRVKRYAELAASYAKLDKAEKEQRYGAVPVVSARDESALQAAAIALKPLDAMDLILSYHKTSAAARRIAEKPSQSAAAAATKLGLALLRAEMKRRGIEPPAQKTVVRERARDLDR